MKSILVGGVPSEPRLPAAPSAPVYETGDEGGSRGSAAAPLGAQTEGSWGWHLTLVLWSSPDGVRVCDH